MCDYSKTLGSLPTPRYMFCRPAFLVFSLLISLWFRLVFRMGERGNVSWLLRLSGAYTTAPNSLGTLVVTPKRIISLLTDEVQLKICRLPRQLFQCVNWSKLMAKMATNLITCLNKKFNSSTMIVHINFQNSHIPLQTTNRLSVYMGFCFLCNQTLDPFEYLSLTSYR